MAGSRPATPGSSGRSSRRSATLFDLTQLATVTRAGPAPAARGPSSLPPTRRIPTACRCCRRSSTGSSRTSPFWSTTSPTRPPTWSGFRSARHRTRLVIYSPIEAGPVEPEQLGHLAGSSYVVYTDVARREIEAAVARAAAYGVAVPSVAAVHVIPHGVDTTTFHPFAGPEGERRSRARAELGLPDGDDSFIVLNANRNLLKKRLDLTLAGFAEFARGKPPGVRLLLHTEPDARWGGTCRSSPGGSAFRGGCSSPAPGGAGRLCRTRRSTRSTTPATSAQHLHRRGVGAGELRARGHGQRPASAADAGPCRDLGRRRTCSRRS